MNAPTRLHTCGLFALAALALALPASAQLLSNGTGGGGFSSGSSWALGTAPVTQAFKVVPGDTITAGAGVAYSGPSNHNNIAGTLTINAGASIEMGRHNYTLLSTETQSVTNVAGGTLSVARLLGVAGTNASVNVSGGSLIIRENSAVLATHYSLWLSGGRIDSAPTAYNAPLFISGGNLSMRNGTTNLSGLASGLWSGGRVTTNTSTLGASITTSLMNAWKSNAANTLALSDKTAKQTLSLGANVSSTQGRIAFSVYSSTNYDNDLITLPTSSHSLTLGSGVILQIDGVALPGVAANYIGKSYKLFTLASGNYSGLAATVPSATWTIGGVAHHIGFTQTLASNGTITVASAVPADPITRADFNLPAQDANGWTMFSPSSDSRLVYVDSVNGNDATAVYYAPGAPNIGANPQLPSGAVLAYKTLTAAKNALREDKPDWLLLKAGGIWTESLDAKRGRSPSERAVVCAYGTGARPELRTGASIGIYDGQLSNIIITGIKFWAHTRDTDGPYFTGYAGSPGFNLFTLAPTDVRVVRDTLIEDCVFRAYSNNVLTGHFVSGNTPITRFVLRRSLISGNYSTTAHAQGIYHTGEGQPVQPSVLLEENTFDHNGWRIQNATANMGDKSDGQATYYNHNIYFTEPKGVILRGNLFLRAASIGNKWSSLGGAGSVKAIVIDNNLYAEGEIGLSIGGNVAGAYRFEDIIVRNNVLTDIGRARPTNRYLSWGIEITDWNSGVVADNLLIHQRNTAITNTSAINVNPGHATDDILIVGNVIANLFAGTTSGSALVRFSGGSLTTNVRFEDNVVQAPTATPLASFTNGGYSFSGDNRYYSTAVATKRFVVNGTFADLPTWQSATGDAGALFAAPAFPASGRDLESYAAHIGVGSTLQDFINALHGQSKATWNPALTARAANNWLREGFGMAPVY